ncbi:hypothetical protein CEP50_11145 [Actinopolyspora mortivallis]|uniref:Uncharacterized protein n=1 Tax=Actinopolyspora mortivallis TaxID=33906 RepID=A0A2T0GW40_ACTMO|nr:hypothetical protein CEP50_11145 [Actinopolyspora mortivallis]
MSEGEHDYHSYEYVADKEKEAYQQHYDSGPSQQDAGAFGFLTEAADRVRAHVFVIDERASDTSVELYHRQPVIALLLRSRCPQPIMISILTPQWHSCARQRWGNQLHHVRSTGPRRQPLGHQRRHAGSHRRRQQGRVHHHPRRRGRAHHDLPGTGGPSSEKIGADRYRQTSHTTWP